MFADLARTRRVMSVEAAQFAMLLAIAFPLFLVSVRHWATGLYYLLALVSLWSLRKGWPLLAREERAFIGIIFLYVAVALLSNTLNGWAPASVRWGEADFRFLLAVPLYLLLRAHPQIAMGLFRGVPIAGVLIGIFASYEAATAGRAEGVYGPIFYGDIAALLAVVSMASVRLPTFPLRLRVPLHLLGAAMALVAMLMTGTRNAWLAALLVFPIAVYYALQGIPDVRLRRGLAFGAMVTVLLLVTAVVMTVPSLTQNRFEVALQQTERYLSAQDEAARAKLADQSVGRRFEQWRLGYALFQERPMFGYGVGNIGHEINRLVAEGRANKRLAVKVPEGPTHLHSAYFDALAYKGAAGLFTLLLVLAWPVYLALRAGSRHPASGVVLVNGLAFAVFASTEDPFIRNAFTSVYLMFALSALALLFAPQKVQTAAR